MHLADLKHHAADYAREHFPHLAGEFAAFVAWLEHKNIDESHSGFRPVVPQEQKVLVAADVTADTSRSEQIAAATRLDADANRERAAAAQADLDRVTADQKAQAEKQKRDAEERVEAQHQESLAQEAAQIRSHEPRAETETQPVPGSQQLVETDEVREERERQEQLARDQSLQQRMALASEEDAATRAALADSNTGSAPSDVEQHVDHGSALSESH